ncbi:TRAP transporter small permease [Bacillus sp. FJAT-44742]|uniref:TRAP transporter small permease n=2 Tax=Bacillaceae TaxID=186817 RepID=UPI000C2502CC|nr:TRAP transporter small permease [Bacillus sp. FJAT-44742]
MWRILDERFEEIILVTTMVIMVFTIFAQVSSRFVLGSSFSWGAELARYMHIWQVWMGASLGIRRQEHVRIDVFVNKFPPMARVVMDITALLVWFGFAMFLAIQGTIYINGIFESGQRSPSLEVPMWVPYLAIPLAGLLMGVRLVQQIIKRVRAPYEVQGKGEM